MSRTYFSKRHGGPRERDVEDVSEALWNALLACIGAFSQKAYFAEAFPDPCPDNPQLNCGVDDGKMINMLKVHIESIKEWPPTYRGPGVRQTEAALDVVEFFYDHISKPGDHVGFHPFFNHHHYFSFDRDAAKEEFKEKINELFMHARLIYELQDNGEITRIGPPVLRDELAHIDFRTTDLELNRMLDSARKKFFSRDIGQRVEALEKLWDAWERLKTLKNPKDKKKSIEELLSATAPESNFRDRLTAEANELTSIGNNFMIRHSEVGKIPIRENHQVDYLFHRMFSMINLLLKNVSMLPAAPKHADIDDGDIPF